jgi:hypothetical protein
VAAGATLFGVWNRHARGGGALPSGVLWLRARLDGRLLGSERIVLIR